MKLFISALALFAFSLPVFASTPYEIYERDIAANDTGVYEQDGWVFFVIKQTCLTDKTYAGTQESKAAEKTFYRRLVEEVSSRNVTFSSDIRGISPELSQRVKSAVAAKYDVNSSIAHQLLFDRNSKQEECVQEYVVTVESNSFKPNSIAIPNSEVTATITQFLMTAIDSEEFPEVSEILNGVGLSELAALYRSVDNMGTLYINLASSDLSEACTGSSCLLSDQPYSKFDINHVVATVIQGKGLAQIHSHRNNVVLAKDYYKKAEANFNNGVNAEAIIDDLTLSLNLNPSSPSAWKMLSNIHRAIGNHEQAYYFATQYLTLVPEDIEGWVYLYAAQTHTNPEMAEKLKYWLSALSVHLELSPWAKKQIGI